MNINQLQQKESTLSASVETLTYQIKKLALLVSSFQVTVWRKRRARLNKELQEVREKLKSYA